MAISSTDSDRWSHLPADHIADISKRLLRMDRCRFRSVCSTWRTSAVLPKTHTALLSSRNLPLPVPGTPDFCPFDSSLRCHDHDYEPRSDDDDDDDVIRQSDVIEYRTYYLQSVKNPNSEGFVATQGEIEERREVPFSPDEPPRDVSKLRFLDLTDYNVYEMNLRHRIMFMGSDGSCLIFDVVANVGEEEVRSGRVACGEVRLMGILEPKGVLMHWRWGQKEWTVVEDIWSVSNEVDEKAFSYVDVVYKKGNRKDGREGKGMFYAVDDCANLAIIDGKCDVEVVKWPGRVPEDRSVWELEAKFLLVSNGSLFVSCY